MRRRRDARTCTRPPDRAVLLCHHLSAFPLLAWATARRPPYLHDATWDHSAGIVVHHG